MAGYSTRDLQAEFLDTIRASQETVVEAVKTWVDTVRAVTPKVPFAQVPLVARKRACVDQAGDRADRKPAQYSVGQKSRVDPAWPESRR